MGEVFEVQDLELGERVALKTIRPDVANAKEMGERFKREVLLARRITHPNVCRVLEFGYYEISPNDEGDSSPKRAMYFTMELVRGQTLTEYLREHGQLKPEEAFPLISQMAAALEAAHETGVVHRDFKSSNVMLVPTENGNRVVVTDFGLARAAATPDRKLTQLTGSGVAVGTPNYMAPEQVEAGEIGPEADIYALGVVIFEMITGAFPFTASTPLALAAKRLNEKPRSPAAVIDGLDNRWERTILRCLERKPKRRFASAAEVVRALESGVPTPDVPQARNLVTRWVALAAVLVVATLIGWRLISSDSGLARESVPGRPTAVSPIAARQAVAVLGFKNTGKPDADWMSTAISEMMRTELAASEHLRTVPGENVTRARAEIGLEEIDSLSMDTLRSLMDLLGADLVVTGSYVVLGGQVRLDLRVQATENGEVLASVPVRGEEEALIDLVVKGGEDVLLALGVGGLTEVEAMGVIAAIPSSPRAAQLYSQGLEKMRGFDLQSAVDQFHLALEVEPDHPFTHAAMADAWSALGYDSRAIEAAQRAFDLSTGLARQERLIIEAQFHELSGHWSEAVEILRSLSTVFPDNPEYGLRLVRAMNSAGDAPGALEVLAGLRLLPAPASEDPRIDLAEAEAAKVTTDFERQAEVAAVAGVKAESVGARMLLAKARLAEGDGLIYLGRFDEGVDRCDEARLIFEFFGDHGSVAEAENVIAVSYAMRGDFPGAEQRFKRALDAFRQIGHAAGECQQLINLGSVNAALGRYNEARSAMEEAVTIARESGEKRLHALAIQNLGTVEWETGRLPEARLAYEEALPLFEETGAKAYVVITLCNLGETLHAMGDAEAADQAYHRAEIAAREIDSPYDVATALAGRGQVAIDAGRIEDARGLLIQAREQFSIAGDPEAEAVILDRLAGVLTSLGDTQAAQKAGEGAVVLRSSDQ
jgi:eukaryotic-like serine/threonine-protein kinase